MPSTSSAAAKHSLEEQSPLSKSCVIYNLPNPKFCIQAKDHWIKLIRTNRRNLERAFEIGNFRRTGIDDGNIARILWKQAEVMSDSPLDTHYRHREKGEKRVQAQLMRATVEKNIGARIDASEPDEVAFDKLVCGYWR